MMLSSQSRSSSSTITRWFSTAFGPCWRTFSHVEVVGTAGLALTGLEVAIQTNPAVVLIDINMPKLAVIEAIELFKAKVWPDCRIVMLSMA